MARGKIVLAPFLLDDLSSTKVRPALCLTEPIGIYQHIVLAFITSVIPASLLETDLVLVSTQADFARTGLKVSSAVRVHRLMTVSVRVILRELGSLSPDAQSQIDARLRKLLDL